MPISARNQLEGKVVEVTVGDIIAHVVVRLKKGDKVTVVIKSTEVMLEKD